MGGKVTTMFASFKARFYALVLLQLLLLGGLIGYKQWTVFAGERILLETIPVDPRDMFRGDYVILSYKVSTPERWQWQESRYQKGETVFVTLRREGRFWVTDGVSKSPPEEGKLFLRGRVRQGTDKDLRVEYGIESYFVPEGKGRELERQAGRGLIVEAVVDHRGRALIRGVQIERPPARR
jgi:uncharacterized membrane-anchored protein